MGLEGGGGLNPAPLMRVLVFAFFKPTNRRINVGDTKFRSTGRRTRQGPFKADERARRRQEGEERNAYWQSLSPSEQLQELNRRGVMATRQRHKLASKLAKMKEA